MEYNYYIVTVKCGHVGRKNYLPIDLPVLAESPKEAAKIARRRSRVKHDWKDAIIAVQTVDQEQYEVVRERNRRDPYLNVRSSTEQRMYCPDLDERIIHNGEELAKIDPLERARRIAFILRKRAIAAFRFMRA